MFGKYLDELKIFENSVSTFSHLERTCNLIVFSAVLKTKFFLEDIV